MILTLVKLKSRPTNVDLVGDTKETTSLVLLSFKSIDKKIIQFNLSSPKELVFKIKAFFKRMILNIQN